MLNTKHEAWTEATVATILALRTWAIRYGASPLKAWDMVSERARLATRRATNPREWTSILMRSLQIGTVDAATASVMIELAGVVDTDADEWLSWVEDEHQFLFALARERADRAKVERKAKKATKAKAGAPAQVDLIPGGE